MAEVVDHFFWITAAFHADAVEAVAFCVIALNDGVRHRVFDDDGISTDKRFVANAAKLMNTRIRAHACFVCDLDVAGECGGVCHDYLAAELAIVGDVGLCHQQIAVADPRHPAAARRAAMDGNEFANMIAFADLGPGRFAGVF